MNVKSDLLLAFLFLEQFFSFFAKKEVQFVGVKSVANKAVCVSSCEVEAESGEYKLYRCKLIRFRQEERGKTEEQV